METKLDSDIFQVGVNVWVKNPYPATETSYRRGNYSPEICSNPVYVLGKVIEETSKSKVVVETLCEPKKLMTLKKSNLLPANSEENVCDMVDLVHLNEATLLHNVHSRFNQKPQQMYTYAGPILLAVNPYRILSNVKGKSLYCDSQVESYQKNSNQLEPHIFQIANNTLTELEKVSLSQSVIISGESGSGKTESTKQIMKFLTSAQSKLSNSKSDSIESRLLKTNPVLEAFGNAKTLRNDNSSRFGKYIQMFFDKKNTSKAIIGGCIRDFLLEKSRVVFQQKNERNYHAFYYLLAGASKEETKKYKLQDASEYMYLCTEKQEIRNKIKNGGGQNVQEAAYKCINFRSDDKENFLELKEALEATGVNDSLQETLFKCLSAILLLGNCDIEDENDRCKFMPKAVKNLQDIAELLELENEELQNQLLVKITNANGQEIVSPLSITQCYDGIYALSKALYENLFRLIVKVMNEALLPSVFDDEDRNNRFQFIGILDIFGFEVFDKNGFEQLCINFANEKLQQLFTHYVFKIEEQIYKEEGIDYSSIVFTDNQEIIDLLEKKPLGVLSLLNETCLFPKSTDLSFLNKCNATHGKKERSNGLYRDAGIRSEHGPAFVIAHSAANVTYSVAEFVEKNRDRLRDNIIKLIQMSKNQFISNLFQANVGGTQNQPQGNFTGSNAFLGSKFKSDIEKLMKVLRSTNPHFVRCIKSNTQKRGRFVEQEVVLHQLRYLGVLESIRIRRCGFSYRDTYPNFYRRFALVVPSLPSPAKLLETKNEADDSKIKSSAKTLANALWKLLKESKPKESHYHTEKFSNLIQFGMTKIFMKNELIQSLETLRIVKLLTLEKAAAKIQGLFRMKFLKRRILVFKTGCVKAQAAWRAMVCRKKWLKYTESIRFIRDHILTWLLSKRYRKQKAATFTIQQFIRRNKLRSEYQKIRRSALTVQCFSRKVSAKAKAQRIRLHQRQVRAANLLEALWKGFIFRKRNNQIIQLLEMRRKERFRYYAILRLQGAWRTHLIKRKYISLRSAAVTIQYWYNSLVLRRHFKQIRKSICFVQRVVRGFLGRCKAHKVKTIRMLEAEKWKIRHFRKEELKQLAIMNRMEPAISWISQIPSGIKPHSKKTFTIKRNINSKEKIVHKAYESSKLLDIDAVADVSETYPNGWALTVARLENALANAGSSPSLIKNVSSGSEHTVALTNSGDVYTWGWGDRGQLGQGKFIPSVEPRKVLFSLTKDVGFKLRITKIAAGNVHTVAVCENGKLYSWGGGGRGQLGHGDTFNKARPQIVVSLNRKKVLDVACGSYHSLALVSTGKLYSWGGGGEQLGHGVYTGDGDCLKPTVVNMLQEERVRNISAGSSFSALTTETGRLFTWGSNSHGQLGLGDKKSRLIPKLVRDLLPFNIESVCCGGLHCCAVTSKGDVFSWGWNAHGQLGLGHTKDCSKPRKIETISNVKQVVLGWRHSMALTTSSIHPVFAWGVSNLHIISATASNESEIQDEENLRLISKVETIFKLPVPVDFNINAGRVPTSMFTSKSHTLSFTGLLYNQNIGTRKASNSPLLGTTQEEIQSKKKKEIPVAVNLNEAILKDLKDSIDNFTLPELKQILEKLVTDANVSKTKHENLHHQDQLGSAMKISEAPKNKPVPPFVRQSSAEFRASQFKTKAPSPPAIVFTNSGRNREWREVREGKVKEDSMLAFFSPPRLLQQKDQTLKKSQEIPQKKLKHKKKRNTKPAFTYFDHEAPSKEKMCSEGDNEEYERKETDESDFPQGKSIRVHQRKKTDKFIPEKSGKVTEKKNQERNITVTEKPMKRRKNRNENGFLNLSSSNGKGKDEDIELILKRIRQKTAEDMKVLLSTFE